MRLLQLNLFLFSFLLSFSGCVTETFYDNASVANNKETATLTLDLTLPKDETHHPAFRSVADKSIEDVYVLGFRVDDEDEAITYFDFLTSVSHTVEDVGGNKKKISFTANQADYKQQFVIIANSAGFVASLNPQGQRKEEVLEALIYINPENEWTASLPMWGESDARVIDDQETTLAITLTRMVARIDIAVAESLRQTFILKEAYLYNAKTRGRIVPDESCWDAAGMKASHASLPPDSDPVNHSLTKASPCRYEVENPENGSLSGVIYAFEAAATENHLQSTALVIGGEYNGQMCYYRIDLTGKDENGEKYPLDLLRNHKYAIQITAVQGEGKPDPEEAFRAVSVELNTLIQAWDMAEVGVMLDEQYALIVSDCLFEVTGDHAVVSLYATTDHPAGLVGRTSSSWISWSGGDDGDPERVLTLSIATNDSGDTRRGTLEIIAGNLIYVVRIVQSAEFIE